MGQLVENLVGIYTTSHKPGKNHHRRPAALDVYVDFRSKSRRVDVVMHDDACGRPGDRIERGLPVEN